MVSVKMVQITVLHPCRASVLATSATSRIFVARRVLWPLIRDGDNLQQASTSADSRPHYLTGNTATACSVHPRVGTTTQGPESVIRCNRQRAVLVLKRRILALAVALLCGTRP